MAVFGGAGFVMLTATGGIVGVYSGLGSRGLGGSFQMLAVAGRSLSAPCVLSNSSLGSTSRSCCSSTTVC